MYHQISCKQIRQQKKNTQNLQNVGQANKKHFVSHPNYSTEQQQQKMAMSPLAELIGVQRWLFLSG